MTFVFVLSVVSPQPLSAIDGLPLGAEFNNTGGGVTGWVRVPDDDGLEPQVFTVEAWIRPLGNGFGGTDDSCGAVITSKGGEGQSGYWLQSYYLAWSAGDNTPFGRGNVPNA